MADETRATRRRVLGYLGAGGVGAVAGALGGHTVALAQAETVELPVIRQNYSPHGVNQAGILTPMPASTELVAYTLLASTDRAALGRLMRLWTSDIEAMMAGVGIPGDTAPEMARPNVSLTVTVGLGPGVFALEGLAGNRPDGFVEIPAMTHDRLEERWSGGDLLVVVSADDPTTVAYATHRLTRDAETFASLAWRQQGSWRGTDADGNPVTGRNLFGQVDGTGNASGAALDPVIWPTDPQEWFVGGTTMVVRRIEMNLTTWDELTRERQEKVIGRNLANGAPLTGTEELDAPDFAKMDEGRPVIPANAHTRLSHPDTNNGRRMLRRGANYTHSEFVDGEWRESAGLVFMAFQADIAEQFVPIQRKLDSSDALNDWTTAIGSAVFALPGGWPEGSWIAEKLLS